jgi:linoleoyl-CoA desaturase
MSSRPSRRIRFSPPAAPGFHREVRRHVNEHLAATGASRFADARLWIKAAVLSGTMAASYGLILSNAVPGWAMLILAAICGGATLLLAINLGHDAAHDALTPHRPLNRLLHHASFALIGADAYLWRLRHVRSHHNFPNVSGCDIDIDENPFLRLSPNHPRRPWQRWQHLYAPAIYACVGLHTAVCGDVLYLRKRELADMRDIRHPPAAWLGFVLGKLIWLGVTFALPLALVDRAWWQVLAGIAVASAATSLLFITLLVGTHFAEEAAFPVPNGEGRLPGDWAEHMLRTSIDWGTGSAVALWISGGVNHHVAHHLFPGVSHVHYRPITRIIAETAAEHGLPHHALSLPGLVSSHLRLLRRLARDEAPPLPAP